MILKLSKCLIFSHSRHRAIKHIGLSKNVSCPSLLKDDWLIFASLRTDNPTKITLIVGIQLHDILPITDHSVPVYNLRWVEWCTNGYNQHRRL